MSIKNQTFYKENQDEFITENVRFRSDKKLPNSKLRSTIVS